jgi:hypothetical protein
VALSTTETEHISMNERSNVASQTSNIFTLPQDGSYDDNQELCIKLLKEPIVP